MANPVSLDMVFELMDVHPSLCQCSAGNISEPMSSLCLQMPNLPFGLYSSPAVPGYIYAFLFVCFLTSLCYPTLFCSLLSCQSPWWWSSISLHTPVSNPQFPLLRLFLKKPIPPVPLSSNQYLFSMKLHGKACVLLINVSPLPNVTLSGEGEMRDRGGRGKQKNKKL